MKEKAKAKSKGLNEKDFLDLLKTVLPKATPDVKLAGRIIDAIETALKRKSQSAAFEKFIERCELPDLEPKTILDVKKQLTAAFGEEAVTVKTDKKAEALQVEVKLPEGTLSGEIKARPLDEDPEGEGLALKFVPFPVSLPADPELVWLLGKQENLHAEEAAIALAKVEEEFWLSKAGQKLIRDRVERTFAEFIARVPAKMLSEQGLKRHYKEPEPIKEFQTLNK